MAGRSTVSDLIKKIKMKAQCFHRTEIPEIVKFVMNLKLCM